MTDEERDALLLRLEAGQKQLWGGLNDLRAGQRGLEVYLRAVARKLLSPTEVMEVERQAAQASAVETADIST